MSEELEFRLTATKMYPIIENLKLMDEMNIKYNSDVEIMKDEVIERYKSGVARLRKYLSEIEQSLNDHQKL